VAHETQHNLFGRNTQHLALNTQHNLFGRNT